MQLPWLPAGASYLRIFVYMVYNICIIGISDAVSDGAIKTLILNMERAINCPNEFEPDVLNTSCTTRIRQILHSRRVQLPLLVLQLFFSLLSLFSFLLFLFTSFIVAIFH